MSEIEVLLNQPRVEIDKIGFRIFRFGRALQLAQIIKGTPDVKGGKSGVNNWGDSDSKDFIRNPGTGAIQVRPSGLRDDFLESVAYATGKFETTDWSYEGNDWEVINFAGYSNQEGSLKGWFPKTTSKTSDITARSVGDPLNIFTSSVNTKLIWTHELKTALQKNTSFGLIVQPMGTALSRGSSLMAIGFGNRFVLEIQTNGKAICYAYLDTLTWKVVGQFDFAASGVKPSDPFQINIVPNAYGYISFFFSQYSQSSKVGASVSGKTARKDTGFTVDMRRYFSIAFDATKGTSNTIPSAKICLAFRKKTFKVLWAAHKNIYDISEHPIATFRPEALPHKIAHAEPAASTSPYKLQLGGFGFESNQTGSDLSGKCRLEVTATHSDGTGLWTNVDKIIPVAVKFYPSTLYSPELWGYRAVIPEKTITPDWTPIDVSDKWQKISFKQSLDHDPSTAEIKLLDFNQKELFKMYGPIEISAKGTKIWEGYMRERKPLLMGGGDSILMYDMFQCFDVSTRFAETPAGFDSIAGITVRNAIERLINQCGIPLADILFEETDDWTNSTTIEQPEGADQDKLWKSDVSVADALGTIFDLYSVQGEDKLFVIRRDGKFVIKSTTFYKYASLSPDYEQPSVRFWLTPPKKASGTWADEQERWDDEQFKVFDPVEFSVEASPFNTVKVTVGKETSEDSKGVSAATIYDVTGSVTDPANDEFVGRIKQRDVDGPKAFQITSLNEAERYARTILDIFGHKRITASWKAEWQPGIYAGDIVSLLGQIEIEDPDNEGEYILKTVSFGAYKIVEMNIELEHDWEVGESKADFSWFANYSTVYYGPSNYTDEDILYFNPGHDGDIVEE